MLDDVLDVARRAADRWYVTVGHAAVGPVNLDLLARGVEAGKVPIDAFVRHEQWKVWRPLSELAVFEGDDVPPSHELTDDVSDAGRISWSTDGGADLAADRRDALLLLMTAAVARGGADAAIVHEIDDDGAVAVCAHGSTRWEALGLRTPRLDPAVVAASTGTTLVVSLDHDGAKPRSGGAGPASDRASVSVVSRLYRVAGPIVGSALLIPILTDGRLVAMIEIGRRTPFQPEEIASLEALVASLAAKLR
jgi:hypothetical protein